MHRHALPLPLEVVSRFGVMVMVLPGKYIDISIAV